MISDIEPLSKADTAPSWGLSDVKIIHADSIDAVREAWRRGVPRTARLLTAAPALLADPDLGAEAIDERLTPAFIRSLEDATLRVSEAFKDMFEDFEEAVVGARAAVVELQRLAVKAACLGEQDFEYPTAVVTVLPNDPKLALFLNHPLTRLLSRNSRLCVVEVAESDLPAFVDPRMPPPSLRRRLAFAGLEGLFYRLALETWSRLPFAGPRGTVLVVRPNELVKETATALLRQGFAVRCLDPVRMPSEKLAEDEKHRIAFDVAGLVRDELGNLMAPVSCDALAREFATDVCEHLSRYRASLPFWRHRMDSLAKLRPRAVLSNALQGPEMTGLYRVLRDTGVPLVVFQHGVTIEINERVSRYRSSYETVTSDLALFFNNEAVTVASEGPYTTGRCSAVGIPKDYRRGARLAGLRGAPPVWYVSQAVYAGLLGQLFEGVRDSDKAVFETEMIRNIFANLPHRVLYKSYPGNRYIDSDPVIETAKAEPNIDVFDARTDLRYIVGSARVLVTGRTFSTPSWCLMTGKPTVLLDIPDQTPLRAEARDAFAKGLFLFNVGAPDFENRLREFLSQPLEAIERQWQAKATARKALVRRFISSAPSGAGERAAREVVREINQAAFREQCV